MSPVRSPGTGTYAVIAAGGTGGHLVPGIAVARALVARGHPADEIHFVGSERKIDAELVAEAGFAFTALPGRGIERRVGLAALKAVFNLLVGVGRGVGLIGRLRPSVVVTFGGFAAVPSIVGAVVWRIPMVVVARDARAGAADRLAGGFARARAVPFADTDLARATVTGNPVRAEVLAVDRSRDRVAARSELGLPQDRTVVAVFTGSLGSSRVNVAVAELARRWRDRHDVAIRHVVGQRDYDQFCEVAVTPPPGGLVYQLVSYEHHMDQLLAAADVAVTRAGGATVAELAVVGLASVLVPLPGATRDHQTANARVLVEAGAAVMVPDDELGADRLTAELAPLVADGSRREAMAAAARKIGRRDAADRVADLVEEHARRG